MPFPSAYLLVFHGSHDPRSQAAAKHLTASFRQRLEQASTPRALSQTGGESGYVASDQPQPNCTMNPIVQDMYLECQSTPLHCQIEQLAARTLTSLLQPADWVVIPVFLLAGVHVKEDIPAEVAIAQHTLASTVRLTVTPHLGCQPGLRHLIAQRLSAVSAEVWILVAHGSRRAGANKPVADLAASVGAIAAYWSVAPSLETCLQELPPRLDRVGILPYFLFSGGITDAIAQTIAELQRSTHRCLILTEPLNPSPELVELLLNLVQPALKANNPKLEFS